MDVRFKSRELAALCSSERRMAERFGSEAGRTIGRRLLDLRAANAETVQQIPTATVEEDGAGKITIRFGVSILVRGVLSSDVMARAVDPDCFVIHELKLVEGGIDGR